jgi:hypothetical protein
MSIKQQTKYVINTMEIDFNSPKLLVVKLDFLRLIIIINQSCKFCRNLYLDELPSVR